MTTVTIIRNDQVVQRIFSWAHEACTWLILSGFLVEDNRHEYTHPYTGWKAKTKHCYSVPARSSRLCFHSASHAQPGPT
jgi:hypothetical protein